jgi:hypothetical protein
MFHYTERQSTGTGTVADRTLIRLLAFAHAGVICETNTEGLHEI